MAWYFYIGLVAAICIAIFNIPQLIHVLKTKNTCGLSTIMLIILTLGDLCFVLNGIGILSGTGSTSSKISAGLPLLLANVFAVIVTAILLFLKLRSVHYARKFQTTEKQFCDNYEAYRTKIRMAKAEKEAAKKVQVPSDPNEPIAG